MEFEIRKDRGRPQGPVKLTREREAYFALVRDGMRSDEACRIVGVHPRTGMKWRNGYSPGAGRPAVPPADPQEREVSLGAGESDDSSRCLRVNERIHIADRLREKAPIRVIAAELGRSPSTVSREVRRNRHPGSGQYRPYAAQFRAEARRPRPKLSKIAGNDELRSVIGDHLARKRSPEQIAALLRRDFPDRPEMHVVHETIYQALYVQGRGELRRELAQALRTGRTVRKPHRLANCRRPRFTHPMVMISDRPAEADDRAVPGHWEGDLIIGKDSASAIGTLVERTTRFVMLVHLPAGRTAEDVRDALIDTVAHLPDHLKRSLTWDQGSEMACHHAFSVATDIPVYFCDPASPWQRGSNENTNGLLRQYFPKGTDLSLHGRARLDAVAAELNDRPRKTLGWDSPAERLYALLAKAS
jgi:transposase, IS30 family